MDTVRRFIAALIAFTRLHVVALGILAGVLLVYSLLGFFVVPRVARAQLESYVAEQLHRQVAVGEIRFNPFVFNASIAGLKLLEADGSPLVSFRHLYVDAELASLWQRAVVLKDVQLAAPSIDLIVAKDGSVNLAQLVPESEPATAEEEPSPPPKVRIGTLAVTQGRVSLIDNTHERPFTAAVTPIKFTLSDFRTDPGYENDYNFAGATLAGERLEWSGEFTMQPLGSSGRFRIQNLQATTLDSYAAETLPFQLASGQASLSGIYRFATAPTLALDVTVPLLQVRDFTLKERSSSAPAPITVRELDVHDVELSHEKHDVAVGRVDVKGAHVSVALERDGSISLMRLLGDDTAISAGSAAAPASPLGDPAPQSSQDAASAWRVHAETIQLSETSILAEDRSVAPVAKFAFDPLAMTVKGWSTDAAAKMQVEAEATINAAGKLLGKGELQLDPLAAQLAVELTDFGLPAIQPYLTSTTAMTLHSGRLAVKGDVSYAATPVSAPPLKFIGEMQVAELRTTDQLVNEDFVKWRNLAVTGIDFTQNPTKLSIDRIVARQPYGRVVIAEDTSLNVTKVLSPPGSEQHPAEEGGTAGRKAEKEQPSSANAAAAEPAFPIRIKAVQVIDGAANFADYSIEPSFATGILELNGTVTGLSSNAASRAKVKLDGKVDRYAPVNIAGQVNLLSAAKYTDLAMNFRNMELTTFNPYSGKFAGYNISKGKLSTELKYLVQDRKLDAAHHIVIDNLEFGAKTDSKDAAPIPLKLAVALLKDRQGVIDLNLPVTGSLDDPKFRLAPIVWQALLNLLTKIVTAPFAALGAMFGGGDELAFVDFAPGSALLPVSETEQLNKLAKALIERPALRLSVPLTVVSAQDGDALARAALTEKLPPDVSAEPPGDDVARRKRIAVFEKIYRETVKAAPSYPPETETKEGVDLDARLKFLERSLIERLRPSDATLTALAQQRARAVQDTLLANAELSPERVFITAELSEGKSESNAVRMELKVE